MAAQRYISDTKIVDDIPSGYVPTRAHDDSEELWEDTDILNLEDFDSKSELKWLHGS